MKPILLKDQLNLSALIEDYNSRAKMSEPMFKGVLYEKLDDGYGNSLLKKVGENTVVVGGAIMALEKLCNVSAQWKPKTLNELYNLNTSVPSVSKDNNYITLFGVGTGGSGSTFGTIVEKDIKRQDVPDLIPLRVTDNLSGEDADKYYFKMTNSEGVPTYYLKEFSTTPIIKTCWKDSADDEHDGTEVLEDISESDRTEGLQTFAEYLLDFNTKDVREYFEANAHLDNARYNSIGLFTGEKVLLPDGTYDYINVRLFSYLNIDNKSVRIKTASQYVYRILSLV